MEYSYRITQTSTHNGVTLHVWRMCKDDSTIISFSDFCQPKISPSKPNNNVQCLHLTCMCMIINKEDYCIVLVLFYSTIPVYRNICYWPQCSWDSMFIATSQYSCTFLHKIPSCILFHWKF